MVIHCAVQLRGLGEVLEILLIILVSPDMRIAPRKGEGIAVNKDVFKNVRVRVVSWNPC